MKDLEFLPQHHIRARRNRRLRLMRLWLLIVLTVSMICWAVVSRAHIEMARYRLAETHQKRTLVNYKQQKETLVRLQAEELRQQKRLELVETLAGDGRGRRTALLSEVCRIIPETVVLTRVEIDRQRREIEAPAGRPTPPVRRRGARAPEPTSEEVDRVRVEGFARDDLSLARFLQEMDEATLLERGELGFSKDAVLNKQSVRVFAATFYARTDSGKDLRAAMR